MFAAYGIDLKQTEAAEARIGRSAIKARLVDALDAWIPLRREEPARRQLANLADAVDGRDEFRHAMREALVKDKQDGLRELAERDTSALPAPVLFSLGLALSHGHAPEAVALLRPAQEQHPDDFGVNFELAYCLHTLTPPHDGEALPFVMAAVALQPADAYARQLFALVLAGQGKLDEAVAKERDAIRLDPSDPITHYNLGNHLKQLAGRLHDPDKL